MRKPVDPQGRWGRLRLGQEAHAQCTAAASPAGRWRNRQGCKSPAAAGALRTRLAQAASRLLRWQIGRRRPAWPRQTEVMVFSGEQNPNRGQQLAMESAPVLKLEDLVVAYPGAPEPTLDGLSLALQPGESLALVGPSGCGKSTVARAVLGLLPEGSRSHGRLELMGSDPRRLRRSALNRLRGEAVGLVFQDPMTRLNPLISIGDHLRDTLMAHGAKAARAEELLLRVGIGPERLKNYPHQFSGGMRQRVAIALAMALQPPLVIADEPTTSLDVSVAGQVMAELTALCQEVGSALLLITHDLAMAGRWCQRMAVMQDGRLLEEAPASEVLLHPRQPLTQRLVAAARRSDS